jgi:long-subunit acyl-CoA synthetase (AMP-forming)
MTQAATTTELPLDRAYHWEETTPDRIYLVQPMGGGVVQELTWKQALDQARRMASHLQSLELPEKSHVALFSKNSAWWILADLAIQMAGHITIPLYPTLAPETIRQILEHSDSKLIFVGKLDGYEAMAPGIPEEMPRIGLPLSPPLGDVPLWDDVIAKHEPIEGKPTRSAEELGTIVYTSGSTGAPKGVMIGFGAMASAARGLGNYLHMEPNDRMLSYLPLAHVMERWLVESCSLYYGFRLYFAEELATFVKDLQRANPTMFLSVPRLWLKFQQGVLAKMPAKKLSRLLRIPIVSGIVRKKILRGLGLESVRFAGSGSAPIPPELIQWYRDLGLELLEGYGMSENFAYSHVSRPGRARVGYVGEPYPDVEHKISEEGEILVKSSGSMMGYYKEPELSEAAFTEDGFLKTGDRGEIDADNRLRITGRVKELFKTSKGKYVAPAPIENKLMTHDDIEQACVTGSGYPQPHALCMLGEAAAGKSRDALAQSLEAHLKALNAQLDHHEQLAFVAVVKDSWQIENGFLTPTMKMKRNVIEETYGSHADGWYERKLTVVWQE